MNPGEHEFLARVLSDEIRLDEHHNILYYHRGRKKWHPKKPREHQLSGRKRIAFGESRTTIYLNRAIWMLVHRQPIPDDHVIDHIDGNRLNDSPDNLRLHSLSESHAQGNSVQSDTILDQLSRWFLFVGTHGREPTHPHEISYVEVGF